MVKGFRSKIRELEENYFIDTTELGKTILVASVAMFFIGGYAVTSFSSANNNLENLQEQQRHLDGILEDEGFQTSYEAIQDISQSEQEVGQQFDEALSAYEQMEDSVNYTEAAKEDLDEKESLYQWVVLISLLGTVSGIALIFL